MSEYAPSNTDFNAPPVAPLEYNSFNPEKSRREKIGRAVMDLLRREANPAYSETIVMPEQDKAKAGLEYLNNLPDKIEAYSDEAREIMGVVSEMALSYNHPRAIDSESLRDMDYSKRINFVNPKDWSDVDASPVRLPVGMFVGAVGIDHFIEGRDGLKSGSPSKKVIKSYAKRSPQEGPSLSSVDIYVTPSGEAFAYVHGDGSHRLAAAKMRGDKMITAYNESIDIFLLDHEVRWPT